mmetsp:Transcript_9117/g.15600  ORF Transcript_9117/g.15600 Transcript_9117/m.15600 type:complete len:273 (-) Transcript_9117:139-957(-)
MGGGCIGCRTPYSGRYTDWAMRDVWRGRKIENKPWGQCGSFADTSEGACRSAMIGARYAGDLMQTGRLAADCIKLTHADPWNVGMSAAYAEIIACVVRGDKYDAQLPSSLMRMAKHHEIPFTSAYQRVGVGESPVVDPMAPGPTSFILGVDHLLYAQFPIKAATDPQIVIPPIKVPQVYGMACSLHYLLPAAYYYASYFAQHADFFEQAVLHAINSGGNNLMRAILTGSLVGAIVGVSKIPQRFIDGLVNGKELLDLAYKVARDAFPDPPPS